MNKQLTIIANWKMNLSLDQAKDLASGIVAAAKKTKHRVGIAPSFPYIPAVLQETDNTPVFVAGQNLASTDLGAYTGEVAASQLKSVGASSVILGHSERREYFQESDAIVNKKIKKALEAGLQVILCVGESLEMREQGQEEAIVTDQLHKDLNELQASQMTSLCIAYEPIWAIGTGKTASSSDAEKMHNTIRNVVAQLYTKEIAQSLPIIYGGSVKPENCADLFLQENINGALVGGASLKIADFSAILGSTV